MKNQLQRIGFLSLGNFTKLQVPSFSIDSISSSISVIHPVLSLEIIAPKYEEGYAIPSISSAAFKQ
jgi:hypothetical protein